MQRVEVHSPGTAEPTLSTPHCSTSTTVCVSMIAMDVKSFLNGSCSHLKTEYFAGVSGDYFLNYVIESRPPLWSSGQSSWLQIQRSQVRFPALSHFLRSSGSGTGSIQPREEN
jgi:hypothetical protein